MVTTRSPLLPSAVVVASAATWGLFWLPLRSFEAHGLDAGWTTLMQFITPLVLLLPFAAYRLIRGRATGLGSIVTGLLLGSAFVLYYESLLLTEVARALILFYITPAWGTALEVMFLGQRITRTRALALMLGFSGLVVILGGDSTIPLPRNAGDVMALISGLVFAIGAMRIRQSPEVDSFEHMFSVFFYGGWVALGFMALPIPELGEIPDWRVTYSLAPWLLLMAVVFLIPTTWGVLWGSQHLDPGRIGILLQMEAVVGIGSAALLANEPFGWREGLGTMLVIGAGTMDVLGQTRAPKR